MKKLNLDGLKVDTFATTDGIDGVRGTVAGYQSAQCTLLNCPVSYGGTCYVTCRQSCYCETAVC